MDDNLKFITEFVASHRDELVLDCFDVVMLKDFADGDDDYYYVVIGERGTYWTSCVGPLYPLKNVLPEDEYNRLEEVYKLNVDMWLSKDKKTKTDAQRSEWEKKWFGKSWYESV